VCAEQRLHRAILLPFNVISIDGPRGGKEARPLLGMWSWDGESEKPTRNDNEPLPASALLLADPAALGQVASTTTGISIDLHCLMA
jgi:hypothetical protein